jgi:hypothetical protein
LEPEDTAQHPGNKAKNADGARLAILGTEVLDMSRNTSTRGFLLTSLAAAALLAAAAASAQPSRPIRTLTEPAYRELRRLAGQLDERAERAADVSQADRYQLLYRRDNTFLRATKDFARRASRFDARLARYRAEPWAVQDDVRLLLRSARDVQIRVRQSRWSDERTLSDWNEIVEIVNRMARASDGRIDLGDRPGPGDFGPPQRVDERDPRAAPPPPDYRRDEPQPRPYERDPNRNPPPPSDHRRDEYGAPAPSGSSDSRGDQLAGLARELEDRSARALQSAERAAAEGGPYRREFMQAIRDFNSQAAAFRQSIGAGTNGPAQIRAEASRLLDFARRNDQRMRQGNAFREVWPDWQGAMQTLQRILDFLR